MLKHLLWLFFGSQARTVTAMVPVVGPAAIVALNKFNDKRFDDRLSTSPMVSMLETVASTPADIVDFAQGKDNGKRVVKDIFTIVGIATGLPMGLAARPVGYLMDVEEGKTKPANAADFARGLVSGTGPRQ